MLELLRRSGLPEGFSAQSQSIDSVISWVHILMLILFPELIHSEGKVDEIINIEKKTV